MENMLMKQECETVEKLNAVVLNKSTGYRAEMYRQNREPVSTKYFLKGFSHYHDDGDLDAKSDRGELKLDYIREEDEVNELLNQGKDKKDEINQIEQTE